jgi:hypothetical protein
VDVILTWQLYARLRDLESYDDFTGMFVVLAQLGAFEIPAFLKVLLPKFPVAGTESMNCEAECELPQRCLLLLMNLTKI